MFHYSSSIIRYVTHLRILGSTYSEINKNLGMHISKGTLSLWCRNIPLAPEYLEKMQRCNKNSWKKAREVSLKNRRERKKTLFQYITAVNDPIAAKISDNYTAKIALAMLCLGEASKSWNGTMFSLGNTDLRVIKLFLSWLKQCFSFDLKKISCTVQHRADQDSQLLTKYWVKQTGIPITQFTRSYIDKRTIGIPTKRKDYMGVLRVTYHDRTIQYELESLAEMVYNRVTLSGP